MALRVLLLALAMHAPAARSEILVVPYAEIAARLDGRIDFQTFPDRPEPGFALDQVIAVPGARLGERFAGQSAAASGGFDRPLGPVVAPLAVLSGGPGHNLAVARHRGFGSVALFPLGPAGHGRIDGRGEGALAVMFDSDQTETGLLVHAAYADPLGARPAGGTVTVDFLGRDGTRLGSVRLPAGAGIQPVGVRSTSAPIAGFLVTNDDPGGIAIDDILFAPPVPLG